MGVEERVARHEVGALVRLLHLREGGADGLQVAGAAVPRFGDFLALTGSVSNAATIYVLPHLMFFRCVPGAPRGEKALSCANVVFGVVSGVVGTVQSARGLFA